MPFIRLITIYIVVIAAVFALFNRDKVMELTGLSQDMFQSDEAEESSGDAGQATAATEAEKVAPAVGGEEAAAKTETEVVVVEPAVENAKAEEAVETVEPEAVTQAITSAPASAPETAPAAEQSVATAPKAEAKADLATALKKARESYRAGNFQQTEAQYVALGDQYPDNADVQGEIGNFYYSQRQYPNAATYYYKTGKALVTAGDTKKLGQIINILQRLAPNLAADLRARAAN